MKAPARREKAEAEPDALTRLAIFDYARNGCPLLLDRPHPGVFVHSFDAVGFSLSIIRKCYPNVDRLLTDADKVQVRDIVTQLVETARAQRGESRRTRRLGREKSSDWKSAD